MPRVKIDILAPGFELPASNGGRIASWQYKARRNLVLFFAHHAACHACRAKLRELARHHDRFREQAAEVLALLPTSADVCRRLAAELSLPFLLLADEDSHVAGRYASTLPGGQANRKQPGAMLVVLDRYREPYDAWVAPDADALPGPGPLLSALNLIALECPECGVPDWS